MSTLQLAHGIEWTLQSRKRWHSKLWLDAHSREFGWSQVPSQGQWVLQQCIYMKGAINESWESLRKQGWNLFSPYIALHYNSSSWKACQEAFRMLCPIVVTPMAKSFIQTIAFLHAIVLWFFPFFFDSLKRECVLKPKSTQIWDEKGC